MGVRHAKQLATVHDSGVVAGGGGHHFTQRERLGMLFLGALVILVIISVGTVMIVHKTDKTPAKQAVKLTTDPYSLALYDASHNDQNAAQKVLDTQLASATTPSQKVEIYDQKMTAALNAKQNDAAISYGEAANKLLATSDTAELMYSAYLAESNVTQAKVWLQKAIDLLNKTDPAYTRILQSLQQEMTEIS